MTLTRTTDHETALAAGFDIVAPGYWVRPDSAQISRIRPEYAVGMLGRPYIARKGDPLPVVGQEAASFYTMREAVAWIGPIELEDHDDCTCTECMERAEERFAYARDNWYS